MRLSDVLQLLDVSHDEDMLNRPGFGTRQRAGSIRSALGVLDASATKSTSLLNKELFSQRLEKLTQLLPQLDALGGRNAGRSMESREMNAALRALHEHGVEPHSAKYNRYSYVLARAANGKPGWTFWASQAVRSQIGTVERQNRKIQ